MRRRKNYIYELVLEILVGIAFAVVFVYLGNSIEKNRLDNKYEFEKDIKFFPIADSTDENSKDVFYENSWGDKRTYGGNRTHEGIDIMAPDNIRGKYPVVSMTDGVVENIGWLELGGYRIGIRSEHGGYFYYAHLYRYSENIKKGAPVKAGQLLGYMGDSGYGSEGTVGMFPVHLHIGIYVNDKNGNEKSINPYKYLNKIKRHTIKYNY